MVSPMLGAIIARSMIETFSDNLLINISFSLMIIRLNLVNNASSGLAPIEFSQIEFHFELYALKSLISTILFIIILSQLTSSIIRLFLV